MDSNVFAAFSFSPTSSSPSHTKPRPSRVLKKIVSPQIAVPREPCTGNGEHQEEGDNKKVVARTHNECRGGIYIDESPPSGVAYKLNALDGENHLAQVDQVVSKSTHAIKLEEKEMHLTARNLHSQTTHPSQSRLQIPEMATEAKSQLSMAGALERKRKAGSQDERVHSTAPGGVELSVKSQVEIEDFGCSIENNVVSGDPSHRIGKVFRIKKVAGTKTAIGNDQEAPANWQTIIDEIRCMRADRDAPVDRLGTHQLANEAADKETQRFHLLVAAMISSQTRDSVTAAAMKRLHSLPSGLNIDSILSNKLSTDQLADILKPVGFYRQKAKHLKVIAEKLGGPPYNGCVPCTLDELVKLPGVGPKVALLVLWVAFGKGEEGLIVDTNVRRVCCRLGWAPEGSNPEQVRASLEPWLPKSLWPEISFMFVGFGQQVCKPVNPMCDTCKVKNLCPSAFESMKRKPLKAKQRSR